jgi:hypothetical protein
MRKSILKYENYYEVDEFGNVYSLDRVMDRDTVYRNGKSATQKVRRQGRVLKNYKAKNGYYVVNLSDGKELKQHYVHFLVAQAFLGVRQGRLTINHKDGNKLNNNVSNLEYCTYAENNRHAVQTGLNKHNVGDFVKKIRVSMVCPKTNNVLKTWDSIKDAEKETNIKHISCAAKGKRKTAGGFKWKHS